METHSFLRTMARSLILESPERVEQRAVLIADPLERLRFLRQEMAPKPVIKLSRVVLPVVHERRRARSWHVASMVACLVVMVAVVPVPTGTEIGRAHV